MHESGEEMSITQRALSLHAQGLSVEEIAEQLKISSEAVREIIVRQWAEDKEKGLMQQKVSGRRTRK